MTEVEVGAATGDRAETGAAAVRVRRLTPDDWRVLRDIRLAALRESPSAFGSTYSREAAFTESDWRGRLEPESTRSATFGAALAGSDRSLAGLSGGFVDDPSAHTVELVSMWVSPNARGRRVGEVLVEPVLAWGRTVGAERLHLWVTEGNLAALRLYERCGFVRTGEREPLLSDPKLTVIGMVRPLQ
ncbi:GNAT family N-acetyltransferase [Actinopolymorpha sp. B9G3]|uniref:GNAT family N-acetyltransferase n=1 Tax=Actinopolymorpha sp. B9G3 TaxID=3158970 RepID=UPI0032D8D86D